MSTKKELKAAYKLHKPQMGVFQIRNSVNGKIFIDCTTDVKAKWNRHLAQLRFGSHRNKAFQKDWNEQEPDNFIFEMLSELAYDDKGDTNYQKEVEFLKEMVLEELNLDIETFY